jgi:hypothetical protein
MALSANSKNHSVSSGRLRIHRICFSFQKDGFFPKGTGDGKRFERGATVLY